jgi:hypothetical protein
MNTENWQKFKLKDIFDIYSSSDKNYLESEDGNVPYISSTQFNNGVSSFVQAEEIIENKNTITIARNGSVGSAFYHSYNYCASPDDVRIFKPKFEMNKYSALFLCTLIEKEKYRFAYGRKFGTKRMQITTIKLPVKESNIIDWQWIEDYVKNTLVPKLPQKAKSVWNNNFDKEKILDKKLSLNTNNWKWFRYDEVFDIKKGKRLTKADMVEGDINYIGATKLNNGITAKISNDSHLHSANTITVSYNGSIAEAFYQITPFWATDDVNVLYPKFQINQYIAMFFCSLIYKEKYRFNYGRKWDKEEMQQSKIKLPITDNGLPDWQFMENYIKSLPYSKSL